MPSVLSENIVTANTITLNHFQNVFSIGFTSMSHCNTSKNKYLYKLEGFDDHWIQVDDNPHATYTNYGFSECITGGKKSFSTKNMAGHNSKSTYCKG